MCHLLPLSTTNRRYHDTSTLFCSWVSRLSLLRVRRVSKLQPREWERHRQLNTASSLGTVPPDEPTTPSLKPATLALGWLQAHRQPNKHTVSGATAGYRQAAWVIDCEVWQSMDSGATRFVWSWQPRHSQLWSHLRLGERGLGAHWVRLTLHHTLWPPHTTAGLIMRPGMLHSGCRMIRVCIPLPRTQLATTTWFQS